MKRDLPPAAFRLLNSGLDVQTHYRREPAPRPEGSLGHLKQGQINRILELEGTMSRRAIADLLKVSRGAVRRHLGWAKQKPGRK
jgi:DNA-binding CsgD family transcriptional regulator